MAALTGNKIKDSYLGLLKSISNGAISSSFVQISDGGGNALPLYLSTSSIKFYNAYTFPSADGTVSGQVLSTDANGTLSWVTSSDNQTLEEVLTSGNTATTAILSTADSNTFGSTTFSNTVTLANNSVVTGTPPTANDASTKIATTAYVDTQVGTSVTSVALSVPTGLSVTGSPITTSGTLAMSYASGYSIPTDASQTNWDTAYNSRITSVVAPLNLSPNQISLGTVGVSKGGTGATTLTGILLGDGTNAISGITSGLGSDGHVLTADGNGGYAFEVSSGDVSISGTPTENQVAIWTDGSTIKGMSALEISTDGTITLSQPNSDDPIVVTNSYNIGGGNIANVTGISNTGFGLDNLNAVTTGNRNVAFGYYSLKNLTIGTDNVAIGYAALQDVTEAIKCVAIGSEALNSVTTGHFNVAVGHTAGSYVSTSTRNTLVGYGAGSQLDTTGTPSGGYNTFIGYQSGGSVTTGTKNVILGSNDGSVYGQSSNHIIISDGDGNVRVYFDNNGQLSLFNEFFFRDSSATGSPIMFSITQGIYTASSPYNTNILNARNNTNISFQTTGNTNALFIQGTTGNVGIGTTSPSSDISGSATLLHLYDGTNNNLASLALQAGNQGSKWEIAALAANALGFFDDGTERLRISSTGLTQINSTSTTALELITNQSASSLRLKNTGSIVADWIMQSGGITAGDLAFYNLDTSAYRLTISSGGAASFTSSSGIPVYIKQNSVDHYGIVVEAKDNDKWLRMGHNGTTGRIETQRNLGSTAHSDLEFATGGTPRLTISTGGNADFSEYIRVKGDTSAFTTGVGVEMSYNSVSNRGQIGVFDRGNSAYKQVYFYASDYIFDTGGTPRLYISSGGNVGIGTTTLDANAQLTVFGNYRTDFIRDYYGGNRAYILRFGANTASSGHVIGSQIVASLASDDVNGSLEFYTKNAGNLENQLTISSGGTATFEGLIKGKGGYQILNGATAYGGIYTYAAISGSGTDYNPTLFSEGNLYFATGGTATKKLTITSEGWLKASNTGTYSYAQNFHQLQTNSSSNTVAFTNTNGTPYGPFIQHTTDGNNTSQYFLVAVGGTTTRFIVYSNGNVANTNNVYGQYSDIKLKENIADATPKLNDLLKVKIKNFNFIGDDTKQIGVIAQELEKIFPSMIDNVADIEDQEVTDEDGNVTTEKVDLGTITKSVKYSVFTPMLIKAIQEQQTIIEDLKARIETLEG